MAITRFITVAGRTIFTKITGGRKERIPGQKRAPKEKPTPEAVKKMNEKYAVVNLSILLNYNFNPCDYHLTLTYAGIPPTPEEAKRFLDAWCRKMNLLYRKKGIIFKRISVTEYFHHRIHHHIVCTGGASMEEIGKLWPHGKIRVSALDETGDYRKLAEYLIKETRKHYRDPEAVSKRRYNCSRTIERPVTKKEEVSYKVFAEDPKPMKGYYIDQDSIYKGEDVLTGLPYVEFVQVSLTEDPRIKKYKRGRKTKIKNPYIGWLDKFEPEQMNFISERQDLNPTNAAYAFGGLLNMKRIHR